MQREDGGIGVRLAGSPALDYTCRMARFPDTQWSLVRRSGLASQRHDAFSALAHAYRPAILAYFRARLAPMDADDATQSFLAASFEHDWWARADAGVASFRTFLLMLLRRHLARCRTTEASMDPLEAESELPDPSPEAERQFDARFALVLTQRALDGLRGEYRDRGEGPRFDAMVRLLSDPPGHGELQLAADALGMGANALSVALKRLRQRWQARLREELMQLCADPDAFAADWAALRQVIGGA